MAIETLASIGSNPVLHFPGVPADQILQSELSELLGARRTLDSLESHAEPLGIDPDAFCSRVVARPIPSTIFSLQLI